MVQINWGLGQGPNSFDNALAQGFQVGSAMRQRREETERRNALAAYAKDPNEQTFGGLADAAPEYAIRARSDMEAQQARQQQQQQQQMATVRQLLAKAGASPEGWAQAVGAAQQLGIDTSAIPQQYDPAWAQQQLFIMNALEKPEGQQILSDAGKRAFDEGFRPGDGRFEARVTELTNAGLQKTIAVQPGGSVARYNPVTGQAEYIVAPQASPSAIGSGIPPEAIEALKRGEGTPEQFDQMFGRGAAASVMGGGAGNGTGGF